MKKFAIPAAIVLALGVIIAVLLGNKAEIDARAKNDTPAAFPVSTLPVGKQKLTESLSLVGTVAAHNDVAVISETQGRITAVLANVGDQKPAGAVLIHVDDELKQANLAAAEVSYQKAKKDLNRFETLHQEGIVPDAQLEGVRHAFKAAEAQQIVARPQLRDTQITTPISGVITAARGLKQLDALDPAPRPGDLSEDRRLEKRAPRFDKKADQAERHDERGASAGRYGRVEPQITV